MLIYVFCGFDMEEILITGGITNQDSISATIDLFQVFTFSVGAKVLRCL
jgi:hypothetical protein